MKRHLALAFSAAAFISLPALAAEQFLFDKEHTSISFSVSHLGFSNMVGRFTDYDGAFYYDQKHPERSSVDITIHPRAVDTVSKKLDEHLQGPDWFNTAKFPDVHFVSTGIRTTGPHDGEITGDLTLLGVTRPVKLIVHENKADYRMVDNAYVAGFSADAIIQRSAFGMKAYVPMVGDMVRLHIEVEGNGQAPEHKSGKAMKKRD